MESNFHFGRNENDKSIIKEKLNCQPRDQSLSTKTHGHSVEFLPLKKEPNLGTHDFVSPAFEQHIITKEVAKIALRRRGITEFT